MHTKNSSEANLLTDPRAETTLAVLPHLPNEIILAIVGLLAFNDLKSARLLSKAWCFCASPSLFVHLTVSPNKEDLDNFNAITQHPQLRSYVRHLWYDGSEFLLQLSKSWYLMELRLQLDSGTWPLHVTKLRSSESEIEDWIQGAIDNRESREYTRTVFCDYKFLREGYRKYHEHAIYQRKCLRDGTFFYRLVQGLKQLDCLKVVNLECSWAINDRPLEPGKGSHLARNWNTGHCRPASWEWGPRTKWSTWKNRALPYKAGNGAEHYCILVSALAKAQRCIKAFRTSLDPRCAIPPYVFDTNLEPRKASLDSRFLLPFHVFNPNFKNRKANKALQFRNDNVIAFSGLEELDFRCATYDHPDSPKVYENIAGLSALLGSMDHLKFLELKLPAFRFGFRYYYIYDQVFPKKMRWENLKHLGLFHLRIGANELILLFLDAMPGLESLEMGEIGLSQGCWEGVFEALKQMHRFEVLNFPIFTRFYHRGTKEILGDRYAKLVIYPQLSAYVKNGKRHPCLLTGQPNSAAREYTRDLEPVLRQRLLDLDSLYWVAEEEDYCDSMQAEGSDRGEIMD